MAGRTWQLATDECEHSVHAEHLPFDQAHLAPQSLEWVGHQDSQSPALVHEKTSSLETSAVAGAFFAGSEIVAERRASIEFSVSPDTKYGSWDYSM